MRAALAIRLSRINLGFYLQLNLLCQLAQASKPSSVGQRDCAFAAAVVGQDGQLATKLEVAKDLAKLHFR